MNEEKGTMTAENSSPNEFKSYKIHTVLAHSYVAYFLFLLVGFLIDLYFPWIRLPSVSIYFGLIILIGACAITIWAQHSSNELARRRTAGHPLNNELFTIGPYAFTRAPTHLGLALLLLGYGLVSESLFIVLLSIFAYIFTRAVYIRKEESLLAQKYGQPYLDYKKVVKF